jgi:hypothetical protein
MLRDKRMEMPARKHDNCRYEQNDFRYCLTGVPDLAAHPAAGRIRRCILK